MNRDLHDNLQFSRGLSPVGVQTNADTPFVSQIIDTANFNSTEFVILTGVNTDADATFTTLVEDGNVSTLSDNVAVPDSCLLGTEVQASFNYADDNKVFKIGYIGPKRYVRVTVTPSGNNSGDALIAGVWVQGGAHKSPV